ncbi:MAG: isoamylase early set domain-containing protein [Bacteroidales bacterium]|nr:isoamylase early set domain-containing protein [Bacteroidales bacterium]
MSVKKQFSKSKPVCKVTFKLSKSQVLNAGKVNIVGDFNNWNESSDELKPLKDGSFSHSIDLDSGREYQFRYLLDGTNWMNDENADRYVASGLGNSDNAVITL